MSHFFSKKEKNVTNGTARHGTARHGIVVGPTASPHKDFSPTMGNTNFITFKDRQALIPHLLKSIDRFGFDGFFISISTKTQRRSWSFMPQGWGFRGWGFIRYFIYFRELRDRRKSFMEEVLNPYLNDSDQWPQGCSKVSIHRNEITIVLW
jgi:hypothetical protein